MTEGPDFACIGLAKAGTGWLYDQLRPHPDFWMPPIKEIRYLHLRHPDVSRAKRMLLRMRRARRDANDGTEDSGQTQNPAAPEKLHDFSERDFKFLKKMSSLKGQEMNIEGYGAMFSFKGDLLTGDITPKYCMMDDETIARMLSAFPKIKVILLLRDPVSRTWSHLAMLHRKGRLDEINLVDVDRFRAALKLENIDYTVRRGLPAEVATRWREKIPEGQLRYFFFDDVVRQPDATRGEILKFLGGNPAKKSGDLPPDHNRKSTLPKLEMSGAIKTILVEALAGELRACRDLFGGHAVEWAKTYGV